MMYKPGPGAMRNPMRDYPRNLPCPCQSGKKFKKCCYLTTPMACAKNEETLKIAAGIHKMKLDYKARRA